MIRYIAFLVILTLFTPTTSQATINSGSDGLSGPLTVAINATTTINLANAVTGTVNDPGNPNGVYDPVKWVIVFKYSTVTINSGATVNFTNHPSGAPVVWLVQGNAIVDGTVTLDGRVGTTTSGQPSEPGPGGFRGGAGSLSQTPGSGGFGPGGGTLALGGNHGGCGSYATAGSGSSGSGPTYGNDLILPLVGGSGGGSNYTWNNGAGAGGGAILLVAGSTVTISGTIRANGGYGQGMGGYAGSGSGGGVRLVAEAITGNGMLSAAGGANGLVGGAGRIRLEANTISFNGASNPAYKFKQPLDASDPVLWPSATAPRIVVTSINGVPVPADPIGRLIPPADVNLTTVSSMTLKLAATNVPINSTMQVRITLKSGQDYTVPATITSGDGTSSVWTSSGFTLPSFGFTAIQARAILP